MRRRLMAVALLLLLGRSAPLAAAQEPLRLETPPKIGALEIVDVDEDGLPDVLSLSGRKLCVWRGVKGTGLIAAPRWTPDLPAEVSFVDVEPALVRPPKGSSAEKDDPALTCLGAEVSGRFRLEAPATEAWAPRRDLPGLGWRDGGRCVFTGLRLGSGEILLPGQAGWEIWDGYERLLALPPLARREVAGSGQFLEDVTTLLQAVPRVMLAQVPPYVNGHHPPVLVWTLAGDRLLRLRGDAPPVSYDVSFLPGSGERRLVDLDGDGRPELVHRDGDNREGRFAFFRIPEPPENAPKDWAPPVAELRQPAAFLRLSGFNLDPDYVDVDGDGLKDFVITTIAIDAPNTLRAVSSGKVTATTLCFLQRKPAPGVPMFPSQPDASVTSDIGVRVRFGYAGTIDVSRSFTILATADLDGDGRKDLVIRVGPSTLAVRRGTAQGVWESEARTADIPPLGPGEELEAYAADFDGKPGDELLLLYRGAESAPDRLLFLRSP